VSGSRQDRSAFWNAKYHAGIPPWDRGEVSPALLGWIEDGLLTPCRILVPGCGRGHEVVELCRRGFSVCAVDIAPLALEHLREELQRAGMEAELVQADVLDWTPHRPFDAIYEQTCLCALPPQDWVAYEHRLRGLLKPGGRLFALFMQTRTEGDGPGQGPPFHCALSDMRQLFPPAHWKWPETEPVRVSHPNGLIELAVVLTLGQTGS
jgi:SAM-dependent methyltransferase